MKKLINKQAELITNIMINAWEKSSKIKPSVQTKRKKGKWPEKIKNLSIKVAKMFREKNCQQKRRRTEDSSIKNKINKGRKKLKKILTEFQEEEKKKYYSTIEKTAPLARIGKILESKNTDLGVLIKDDGSYTTSPEETLNYLADELIGKEIAKTKKGNKKQKTYTKEEDKIQMEKFLNEKRFRHAINELKMKKAAGPDDIYNEIIIQSQDLLMNPLLEVMKKCIQFSYTPKIWQNNNSAIIGKPDKSDYSKRQSHFE